MPQVNLFGGEPPGYRTGYRIGLWLVRMTPDWMFALYARYRKRKDP